MLRAQGLFPDRQSPLVKGLSLRVLTLGVVEQRQVGEACCHVGVLRAQGLFPDRQSPLVKGLGLRVLTLGVVEPRQVVEALCHVGVLRAQGLFPDRQSPPAVAARGTGRRFRMRIPCSLDDGVFLREEVLAPGGLDESLLIRLNYIPVRR